MKNYFLILFVISIIFTSKKTYCQVKKNNFTFEVGGIYVAPKQKEFHLINDKEFADDFFYDMKIYPQNSFGVAVNFGYLINLKTINKIKIKLPINIVYSNFSIKSKQFGYYAGGFAQTYFYGNRSLELTYNTISLSTGIDLVYINNNSNEWNISAGLSLNLTTKTFVKVNEVPVDLVSYKMVNEKYSYEDGSLLPSLNFKVSRLYRVNNVLIGPFITINNYFISNKQHPSVFNSFNNTTYYYLLETGLKLKL